MPACWIEINLEAIRHNYRSIERLVGPGTSIIAVIKANAYGHGAVEVGRELAEAGAKALAVTRLEEALPLRAAGINAPILLLTPALPDEVDEVVAHDLIACVTGPEDAELLSAAAGRRGAQSRAHLKIDTGMGRLGVDPAVAIEVATQISQLPNLQLEATFTHFAKAAERDVAATQHQYGQFQPLLHRLLRVIGLDPKNSHCANSAALLRFPSMRLSCVRPGTLLYGQFPSVQASEAAELQDFKLQDTFTVKARIIAVRSLRAGQTVGYGSEWRAARPSRIATIAVGYADGLSQEPNTHYIAPPAALRRSMLQSARHLAQWTGLKSGETPRTVNWRGQKAEIIGRIAMQQCSIDITHLPEVVVGDEVSVAMRRTSAGGHLPRVYRRA